VDVFLNFFEAKSPGKNLWVSFNGVTGRVLLTLFQQSYKGFKGKFFRGCCTDHNCTFLDGFPLYWVRKLEFKKPRTLEELTPHDRKLCQVLASLGPVFNTVQLIKHEYNVEALKGYIGTDFTLSCLACYHTISLVPSASSYSYVYPCILDFFLTSCILNFGIGIVMNEEKQAKLDDALARRQEASGAAGAFAPPTPVSATATPSPTPSTPIVAVPLVVA